MKCHPVSLRFGSQYEFKGVPCGGRTASEINTAVFHAQEKAKNRGSALKLISNFDRDDIFRILTNSAEGDDFHREEELRLLTVAIQERLAVLRPNRSDRALIQRLERVAVFFQKEYHQLISKTPTASLDMDM